MTSSIAVVRARGKIFPARMQYLGMADNDCVGVREDKTCEVAGGIRVIVLGNFVESLERRGPEINVLRQRLNVLRDIYVVLAINAEQSNVYLPQKRDTISNFYQERSQTSPVMSNVSCLLAIFLNREVSSTIKSIDRYNKLKSCKYLLKQLKYFCAIVYLINRNIIKSKSNVDRIRKGTMPLWQRKFGANSIIAFFFYKKKIWTDASEICWRLDR